MKKKAFAFDLDGTVVDSRVDIVNSVNKTLKYYNLHQLPFDTIVSYVGNGARVLMERVLKESLNFINLDDAVKKFREIYLEECVNESRIFEDIIESINIIKLKNHLLFLITNKPSPHSIKILKHFGIYEQFNEICCQDTMKALKPDPITIMDLLSKYQIKPENFYMIGDSKVDIEFAKRSGTKSIMVGYGGVIPEEEFQSTESDYKVKTSRELKELIILLV